jgi:hypothetical protein
MLEVMKMNFEQGLRMLVDYCDNRVRLCRPSWGQNKGIYLYDYDSTIYFGSDERGFKFDRCDLFANDYVILPIEKYEQKLLEHKEC